MKTIIICKLFILSLLSFPVLAQQGKISGQIVDAQTGEELIGATVQVEGLSVGTVTDISGYYQLTVDPGTYTLQISYVSYAPQTIQDVEVKAGATTKLDFTLKEESTELQEVIVSAEAIRDNDVALLKIQKNALAVQDGISAKEMGQLGASNAAESMKQVTGASIEDGKYVVMRGLGDRYSISQLNGVTLPSADPYRNSSSLDLIPSDMVDNIVTVKTYTPDQPGNFTGGKVDITTKSLPDEFYLNIGVSGTYNTQSSLTNNFLTDATRGQWDVFGYDDGTRSRPEVLDQYADQIRFGVARSTANAGQIPAYEQQRNVINETAGALDNPFVAGTERAPINHSLNFSMGNTVQFLGKNLGYNVGINYDKGYNYYNDGANGFYTQANAGEMVTEQNFSTENGAKNTQLGGLVSLAYQFSPNHEITLTNLYNHVNTTTARIANGYWRNTSRPFYEDRYINFEERELNNTQLQGEHFFEPLNGAKLEWTLGYVTSTQDNPDLRQWGYTNTGANNSGTYLLQQSEVGFLPSHFYRYLTDKQYTAKLDIAIPFSQNKENEIKLGFNYATLDRNFDEFIYSYVQVAKTQYNPDYVTFAEAAGNFQQFFSPENTGFINTPETNGTGRGYGYGNYYSDQTNPENAYTGSSKVAATYLMAAYKLLPRLKVIGGARLEITDLGAESKASSSRGGSIKETDILPALSAIYQATENSNLRAAVSQTLARPNIREIAPFAALGGIAFPIYLGNENLKRTLIQNYDLRYEIYPKAGELFAVSAYYKNFNHPIVWQLTPNASTPEIKPINVDEATVYGAEVEFRKSLDFIAPALHNLRLSTNVSYIFSRVNKSPEELAALRNADRPNIEDTRPFQGQSPYIVNVSLFHTSDKLAWENTVSFNVFGDRLSFVTGALDPDVYEQSRPSLNFVSKKRLGDNISIGLSATNLLNMEYRQEYTDFSNVFESYRVGRSYSVSFNYSF